MTATPALRLVDPFDLPEWLGEHDVTWSADDGLRTGSTVAGRLDGEGQPSLPCDLLAVDEAFPMPVAVESTRQRAHQSWRHGEVLLVDRDGRLTLAVPGTTFTADLVLDAIGRLARSVGASADHYAVHLRIGVARP